MCGGARLRAAAIGGHEERGEVAGATRRLPENLRFSLDACERSESANREAGEV